MKRVFMQVFTMIIVSSLLLFAGYFFGIKLLMFSYYEETTTGLETGGSILPFVFAAICSYFIDKVYYRKQKNNLIKE